MHRTIILLDQSSICQLVQKHEFCLTPMLRSSTMRWLMIRTYQQKTAEVQHDWYIVDASGQRLGTLAVRIARALSGKHKPTWTPHVDDGDHVVVINAEKIELGGQKWDKKLYYRHSGYPGGLRRQTAREILEKKPERLLENAVRGMLPTNRMREQQLRRLNVYVGPNHPHDAQKPKPLF